MHRAFVNVYLACEDSGGGWSSAGGTVVRYNLMDTAGSEAMFDFPLHESGDFDSITNVWMHVTMVVQRQSIVTYDNGEAVPDGIYGFFKSTPKSMNNAYPKPSQLNNPMGNITLGTDIVIGGRADKNGDRHFRGKMAMLQVYSRALQATEARCIFRSGDKMLPSPLAIYNSSGMVLL